MWSQIRHNNKPPNVLRVIKTRFRRPFNRSIGRLYFSDDITQILLYYVYDCASEQEKTKTTTKKCGNKHGFFIDIIISIFGVFQTWPFDVISIKFILSLTLQSLLSFLQLAYTKSPETRVCLYNNNIEWIQKLVQKRNAHTRILYNYSPQDDYISCNKVGVINNYTSLIVVVQ